jgi:two-component system, NtrC family, sensor histidine kinase HydH
MKDSEIARMSHVLRGRLQNALLNLQCVAVQHQGDAATQELVGVVRQEILDESRLLVAAFEVLSMDIARLQRVNLGSLVRQTLRVHRLRHVIVADLDWPEIMGDIQLLSLAVAHLVRNACEATPPGGRLPEIAAAVRSKERIDVLVRDWGRGFDPHSRAFSSKRPSHVATGLLTAQRIARLHGGRLSFQSSHHGTQVRLALPARPFLFTVRAGRRAPRIASRE